MHRLASFSTNIDRIKQQPAICEFVINKVFADLEKRKADSPSMAFSAEFFRGERLIISINCLDLAESHRCGTMAAPNRIAAVSQCLGVFLSYYVVPQYPGVFLS